MKPLLHLTKAYGYLSAFLRLSFSSAFDTVGHGILLELVFWDTTLSISPPAFLATLSGLKVGAPGLIPQSSSLYMCDVTSASLLLLLCWQLPYLYLHTWLTEHRFLYATVYQHLFRCLVVKQDHDHSSLSWEHVKISRMCLRRCVLFHIRSSTLFPSPPTPGLSS